jgi:lipid-binding SYLF domain-containing protein
MGAGGQIGNYKLKKVQKETALIVSRHSIGAELTDFVLVLNSQDAVKTFSQFGNVTLGGNVSGKRLIRHGKAL